MEKNCKEDFCVDDLVSFKKLKGGSYVNGTVLGFKIDKPTGNLYVKVKDKETGKTLLVQIKKLTKEIQVQK